ncbi:MAG: LiaF domain-containing protein [Spirochaetia bacterium]
MERFREEVIEKLSSSYSRDYMNQQEFEQRVELATAAGTHEELRKLLMDLPPAGAPDPPVEIRADRRELLINDGDATNESTVIAIFSGADRKGVWDAPKHLNVVAMFGGADIDLRQARIPAGGLAINVAALFGGVDIVIPEDLNVEVSGAGIFGGFGGKNHRGSSDPRTPTVKITGVAIFGGVEIKIKRR